MNFSAFWTALETLEKTIAISTPVALTVKRAYWGAPPQSLTDLPCVINALTETDRLLGFGSREEKVRVQVQMFVAPATGDDTANCLNATALWFAAKDGFDRNFRLSGTVSFATLKGADPTVPVLLAHGGKAYIGFNAYLEILCHEGFAFGGS